MKYFLAFMFCLNFVIFSWGQSTSSRDAELKALEDKKMGRDPIANRQSEMSKAVDNRSLDKLSETDRSGEFIRKRNNGRTETKEDKKQFDIIRAPNPEDVLLYKDFLEQKNTGIFKLFPDLGCVSRGVIRVDGECSNAVSGSSFYSFLKKGYSGTDLELKEGNLVSDSFLSQNILVSLGNIDIESVSLNMEQAKFLVDFKPETKSKKAKEQFWQIAQKVTANNFVYGKVAKIYDYEAYLMRIIAYRSDIFFDKTRRDKIIAFKIIRKDSDGSITIVWKELSDKKSPKIEFEKDEKPTDLKEK